MSFENLNLHAQILKNLKESGYETPTPIQLKAIPKVMQGFDIKASAQTGTGKTAAFLLPALERVLTPRPEGKSGPRVLILVPTRELGLQIASQAEKYSRYLKKVRTVCVGGGIPLPVQIKALSRPYEILIATPGRLIDLMDRRKISLQNLEMLVLDEADRMLDMGFIDAVEKIVSASPASRQTLLFSATLRGAVVKLAEKLLTKPLEIVVHADQAKHDKITQKLHLVDDLGHKNRLLDHILNDESLAHAIIFTATKSYCEELADDLQEKGHFSAALHGDMNQRQRNRTITKFRNGTIKVLVATDVAARGIDVQTISHVINFDLPHNVEDYVHRIGRTGRAGSMGTALSFAANRDGQLVKKIQEYTGHKMEVVEIAGLEPKLKNSPPRKNKSRKFAPKNSFGKRRFKPAGRHRR